MIELRSSPLTATFQQFMENLRSPCLICSPYISAGPVDRMLASIERRQLQHSLRLRIVTDLSLNNLVSGNTDISALIRLAERVSDVAVSYLPRVHAKVYISGDDLALIGSANFTDGGAYRNFEYVASVSEAGLVQTIRSDIERYADLGGRLSIDSLKKIQRQVAELKDAVRDEQRSIRAKLRAAAATLEREAEDQLLRSRIEGRSIASILADTILYLLADNPLRTVELEARIQGVHPDICDNSLDRVIDGEHFGKLWKHQVRNSQQTLKRANLITYDPVRRLWALSPGGKSAPV